MTIINGQILNDSTFRGAMNHGIAANPQNIYICSHISIGG